VEAGHESIDDPSRDDLDSTQGSEAGGIEEVSAQRTGALHGAETSVLARAGARWRARGTRGFGGLGLWGFGDLPVIDVRWKSSK
jgi:hypothetical protein